MCTCNFNNGLYWILDPNNNIYDNKQQITSFFVVIRVEIICITLRARPENEKSILYCSFWAERESDPCIRYQWRLKLRSVTMIRVKRYTATTRMRTRTYVKRNIRFEFFLSSCFRPFSLQMSAYKKTYKHSFLLTHNQTKHIWFVFKKTHTFFHWNEKNIAWLIL